MRLLIVRHGDPDYSIDSLTPTGWKEAELLSHRLAKLDVKAFYSSPLGRAKDTASLTLQKMNRTAEVLPWLREFSPAGRDPNKKGNKPMWDWLPQDWTNEPQLYHPNTWFDQPDYAAANAKAEYQWVTQCLDELLAKHGYVRQGNLYRAENPNEDTIVLFCHFGLECVLLGHLLGISPAVMWHSFCAAPSSVTTLTTEERREGIAYFRMSSFGDISHLYAAGQEPAFAARFCEMYSNADQRHD